MVSNPTGAPSVVTLTPADLCKLVHCLGDQVPRLQRAEFTSHTNDDNKDKDTGVDVVVVSADGRSELARIENADNSADDATEYNDGSDHRIPLVVSSPGAARADCQRFQVTVRIRPNGNDTWRFDGRVTLFFSDGTTLYKESLGQTLHEDRREFTF